MKRNVCVLWRWCLLGAQLGVGDVIVAVDGDDTSSFDHEALVQLLASKKDQDKMLTVRRTKPVAAAAAAP